MDKIIFNLKKMKYLFTILILVIFYQAGWTNPDIILKNKNDNESIDTYTISDTYDVNNVDISNKATFTVPVGHTLIVHGNLNVHQAYLYVYGTLELQGDVNANLTVQTSGNGGIIIDENATVIFNGDNQTLDLSGGTEIDFSNVEINDPGLEINGTYTITGDVTLGPDITDPGNLNINLPTPCFIVDTNQSITSGVTKMVSCVTVNNGFSLSIETGAKLVVTENISNDGTISGDDGSLELAGSANQTISGIGSITIGGLVMSNTSSANTLDIQQSIDVKESVKLNGGVFTPNGNVTLVSTSPTDYAILKKVESNASLAAGTAGNINYQKHIGSSSITQSGWWLFGPTLESITLAQWSEFAYKYVYYYNEPSGRWARTTTSLDNGLGQSIYLFASNFTSGSKLLEESGRPNVGTQSFNVTSDGTYDGTLENYGWNLITNPYPAPIDWSTVAGWTKNNMIGSFYIWDAAAGDYTEIVSGVGNTVIAPGQSFWVKVNDINLAASLSVTEDAKSETRSSIYRKQSVDPLLTVEMTDPAANADKMYLRLKDGATDEFDSEFDAYKMSGNHLAISSITEKGTELSINSLPADLIQKSIQLKVTSKQKGTHQLNFSLANFEYQKMVLKDNYLNKSINLEEVSSYQFEITTEAASFGSERFELIISQESQFVIKPQTVYNNKTAEIPVTVSNFKNILAAQFSLSWDESLLKLNQVHSFGLASLTEAHFNQVNASSLTFVWDQQDLVPQSLEEGDTLFIMQFEITSASEVSTSFLFPGTDVAPEVIGEGLVSLGSAFQTGEVAIKTTKTISGYVKDVNQKPVSAQLVVMGTDETVSTDASGKYSIELSSDQASELYIQSNDKSNKSGISTLDILLVRRHLLAQEIISNPFVMSAADVDGSGSISVMDIALIRQVILGYEDNVTTNQSWRYLSAETHEEKVMAQDPEQSYDFVAVKIGDLNGSWNTDNSRLTSSELLQINSVPASSGQQVEIPVSINQTQTITGMQMTINYDAEKLSLQDIAASDLQVNFHISKPGQAIVQWDDYQATGLIYQADEVLFNLVFTVTGKAGETAAVSLNSDLTSATIVDDQLNEYLVASSIAEVNISDAFDTEVSFGNYPNPVAERTNIIFNAVEAGPAKIILYDVNGHQMESFIENASTGFNSIEWENKNYKSGTYILKMQQGNQSYTTRMLIK